MKKFLALVLTLALTLSAVGCAASSKTDLMKGVQPLPVTDELVPVDGENAVDPTDFAVRLFQTAFDGEGNAMLSPVSVLFALGMTANGAKGDTLTQMEEVLGMNIAELNSYRKAYWYALPENHKKCKLHEADSIWFTDDERFTVEESFLQTNGAYYDADIYQVPFNQKTCDSINAWIEDNTDGMIKNALDEIPPEAVMYLINAIAFEAQWKEVYEKYQIRDGVFTTEDGAVQDVQMMHSEEFGYLDDGNATGFIKPYAGGDYAFVALLPNEGMGVGAYVDTLTGKGLADLLSAPQNEPVHVALPQFESEYSVELSEVLKQMGMADAFDAGTADFSGLGSSTGGNIFINRVIHKTYISVDDQGTKAAAVTIVAPADGGAPSPEEPKEVILDRPFVYMIIDCRANLPLFMGAVMSAE